MKYLGIDGGGSKTTAILADTEDNRMRTVIKGPGSFSLIGADGIKKLVSEILHELLTGDSEEVISGATMSFAGVGREQERVLIKEELSSVGINDFFITTDVSMLHYAAYRETNGILLAAGTGSVCVIRENDIEKQFGGWGFLLGDEGGGFFIGSKAISFVLLSEEKGVTDSRFVKSVMSFYDVSKPRELITKVYEADNAQTYIASSAKLVCDMADEGEVSAQRIVSAAAGALWNLVTFSIECFKPQPPFRLACAGSILNNESPVLKSLKHIINEDEADLKLIDIDMGPAAAGVIRAILNSGENVPDILYKNLCGITF